MSGLIEDADRAWVACLRATFPPDALDRLSRAEYDYYSTHGDYVPGLAKLARLYHDAGNALATIPSRGVDS